MEIFFNISVSSSNLSFSIMFLGCGVGFWRKMGGQLTGLDELEEIMTLVDTVALVVATNIPTIAEQSENSYGVAETIDRTA